MVNILLSQRWAWCECPRVRARDVSILTIIGPGFTLAPAHCTVDFYWGSPIHLPVTPAWPVKSVRIAVHHPWITLCILCWTMKGKLHFIFFFPGQNKWLRYIEWTRRAHNTPTSYICQSRVPNYFYYVHGWAATMCNVTNVNTYFKTDNGNEE